MAKQVPWNEIIYSEFCRLAMLSDFEKDVLKTRIQGYSIIQQSMKFKCSESTISRTIAVLKEKYDRVQPYSEKLPVRKTSAQEKWQDEN